MRAAHCRLWLHSTHGDVSKTSGQGLALLSAISCTVLLCLHPAFQWKVGLC